MTFQGYRDEMCSLTCLLCQVTFSSVFCCQLSFMYSLCVVTEECWCNLTALEIILGYLLCVHTECRMSMLSLGLDINGEGQVQAILFCLTGSMQ